MELFNIIVCVLWLIVGIDYIVQHHYGIEPKWWQLWIVYGCFMACDVIPKCITSIMGLI